MKTTCPYCGVGCGVELKVTGDTVETVCGDRQHPANRGRLCIKGSSLHETLQPQGRLLHPLVDGRRASWGEALNRVADGFRRTIAEHGPDSVAFYLSGQLLTEDYYVANKLMKGFIGSANVDTNSRLCMSSAVVGYKRAFGSDTVPVCYEDLELADLLVLVGSNAAWNHPVLFQRMQAAKQANPHMKVVVVDPRSTATCELADLHLQLRPGSDSLLFNGLLAWLAAQGALDTEFIDQHCEDFDEALAAARNEAGALARLAEGCQLSREDLLTFFGWFRARERSVTFYSQGVNQSASGADNANAIINCHLATGRIGRPGMGPFSITGQPNAMGGREVGGLANQLAAHMDFNTPGAIDRVGRFWRARNMARREGLKAVELFQAIERGEIKAVWIMATNPVVSMPDADQVKRALERCPLVVVSDCSAPTDSGQLADILLPATGWSEKNGTVTNSERRISRQRGLLPPPGEARHDWQIVSEVARRMGFADAFDYRSPAEIFREHARLSAFENNGTRDFDIGVLADLSDAQYDALAPIQWPVTEAAPTGTARMFSDGRFFTASGRARFVRIRSRRPQQQPSAETPLIMNTGRIRDQWHTMTRTGNAARLFQHRAEPFVALHPDDARRYAVREGDLVRLHNARGQLLLRAQLDDGQRPGELFVPMHWNGQFSGAARMGSLIAPVTDPNSGQPELKHASVALRRYPSRWQAWLICRDAQAWAEDLYWARIPQTHSIRYHLAGDQPVDDWHQWCRQRLGEPVLWLDDPAAGRFRAAGLKDGRLQWLLLVLPYRQFPDPGWLDQRFAEPRLEPAARRQLLSASAADKPDCGAIVCSCFQVGERQIADAMAAGIDSVEALGSRLKCGSNCGSCIPELKALLRKAG